MEKIDKKSIIESLDHPERYVLTEDEIAALPTDEDVAKVDVYLKHKFRNDLNSAFGLKPKKTRKDLQEIAHNMGYNMYKIEEE